MLEFHRPGGGTAGLRCPGTEVRLPRADRYSVLLTVGPLGPLPTCGKVGGCGAADCVTAWRPVRFLQVTLWRGLRLRDLG